MNVLVVDDHPLIRTGIAAMLARHDAQCVVREVSDCRSALDTLARGSFVFDLILLDLSLPDSTGLASLSAVREAAPTTPVVVFSAENDRKTILEAINLGAMGFIPKTMSPELIWSALGLVLAGGIYVPYEIVAGNRETKPSTHLRPAAKDGVVALKTLGLTVRQIDTLRMLIRGLPNKTIARTLGIAEATVKVYVSAVLRALNVTSRTQAVIWLSQNGIQFDALSGTPSSVDGDSA